MPRPRRQRRPPVRLTNQWLLVMLERRPPARLSAQAVHALDELEAEAKAKLEGHELTRLQGRIDRLRAGGSTNGSDE